ncbi:MAG: SRPBCC family protein [Saprospiraceae bacterium]
MESKLHQDIRKSFTIPTDYYNQETYFEASKDSIFGSTWQYVDSLSKRNFSNKCEPFFLLPGILDEPLLMTKNEEDSFHCLSNVCTHRGMILQEESGNQNRLRCRYHGRCFDLKGKFLSMPKFEEAENFPSDLDNLNQVPFSLKFDSLFVSLNPFISFDELLEPITKRLSWLPLEELELVPEVSKDYTVKAHWALYCENYLEGFHIPFVHPALNRAIEFDDYESFLYPYCNLQLGIAKEDEPSFEIPSGAEDFGKRVYGYYWWVFPNLMLNFYPWGLSLNYVQPINKTESKVLFRSYKFPNQTFNREEFQLDKTEMEDESVVEKVQLGVKSRFYSAGRFSPSMEKGVHHFHLLLKEFLKI